MASTPTYQSWFDAIRRCTDESRIEFPNYGGRGIRVAQRWARFENFFADMGERPEGTSLDRIDNGGDYRPGNCRWATATEQARNKRANRILLHAGQSMLAVEWAEQLGICVDTILARIDNLGWDVGKALTTPVLARGKRKSGNLWFTHDGRRMILTDWARAAGIPYRTLWHRVTVARWPIERALVP